MRALMVFCLLAKLSSSLLLLSCRGTGPSSSEALLINAVPTSDYPAVVELEFLSKEGKGICTGSFVSDQHLVTAAHCLPAPEEQGFELFITREGKKIAAASYIRHPQFQDLAAGAAPTAKDGRYDLAVVTFPVATAPATLALPKATGAKVGELVTLVGYGITATDAAFNTAHIKRMGSNTIKLAQDGIFALSDMTRKVLTQTQPGEIVAAARGDSGGPALNRQGEIVGIISRGVKIEASVFFFLCDIASPSSQAFLKQQLPK